MTSSSSESERSELLCQSQLQYYHVMLTSAIGFTIIVGMAKSLTDNYSRYVHTYIRTHT